MTMIECPSAVYEQGERSATFNVQSQKIYKFLQVKNEAGTKIKNRH